MRGDLHVFDERHLFGLRDTTDFLQPSCPGDGNHHHTGGQVLALERRDRHAERVPQDDLLKRNLLVSEAQHG